MDIKRYTDEKYVPINDLNSLGPDFVTMTHQYRQNFMEIIPIGDFEFVNLVETPKLLKKRYEKNVELKGQMNIVIESNDYILEIAKKIVNGEIIYGIDQNKITKVKEKFIKNNKDLTIITNWLIENYEMLIQNKKEEIVYDIPELTSNDIKFINTFFKRGQHYSINDYIELNDTSYETGRKALEKMKDLNLYKKTKLGKKFVYSPTTKLANTMKGGKYGN